MKMKKLNFNELDLLVGGVTRTERNTDCVALALAAGIASGLKPLVGGLTTLNCMLTVSYN